MGKNLLGEFLRVRRKKVKNTRTTTREYLFSEHWKQLTKSFSSNLEICEICGTPHWHKKKDGTWKANRYFVWHHKHYRTVGNESREDLMRICKRCHDECHRILRMKEDCDLVLNLKNEVRKYFFYEPTERKKK